MLAWLKDKEGDFLPDRLLFSKAKTLTSCQSLIQSQYKSVRLTVLLFMYSTNRIYESEIRYFLGVITAKK